MDDIIAIIRALVVSQKEININDVGRDFYQLEGYTIPFKKFGFSRLDNFLESSGEFYINRVNGEQRIMVKKSDSSAHISKLVTQQKRVSKKKTKTIPQRKLRVTQNLQSYAYSNVYSKLPSRSVTKHALQNRLTNNLTITTKSNDIPNSKNVSLPRRESSSQLVKTIDNSDNVRRSENTTKSVSTSPIESPENVPKKPLTLSSRKENIIPSIPKQPLNMVFSINQIVQPLECSSRPKTETGESKTARRMWRQNSLPNEKPNKSPIVVNNKPNSSASTHHHINTVISAKPLNPTCDSLPFKLTPARMSAAPSVPSHKSVMSRLTNISNGAITVKCYNDASKPLSSRLIIKNTPTAIVQPNVESNPLILLEQFCVEHNISKPVYILFKIHKTSGMHCKVKLNGSSYSTYPNEFTSELDAKYAVATLALSRLEKSIKCNAKYPQCMDSESELTIKIYEAIKSYTNGLFSQNVPEYFENMYQQSLPNDWYRLIENSPQLFSLENSFDQRKIIYANVNLNAIDLANIFDNDFQLMDKLILPWTEKHWNIFITNPISTVEIWGRLVGPEYSDKMDALIIDIELSLLSNKIIPTKINIGCIYLVIISECTYRVRVDRTDSILRRCLCVFIDVGDEEWFDMDDIYICESRFFKFPAQAICFSLFGLEDFAENPHAKYHLQDKLANNILIGDIQTSQEEYLEQEAKADELPKICVGLYDTTSDEDVCLNPIILQSICNDTEVPKFKAGITNVTITHINDKGEIYCQIHNRGIGYIEKIIHHLSKMDFNQKEHGIIYAKTAKPRDLYLVFDERTQKWCRAQIKLTIDTKCLLYFVDYGIERIIEMVNIYRLDVLSGALNTYPHQAIKVKLSGITGWTENMVSTLKGYLTSNTTALVKVITHLSVPEVNIYKQFEKSSPLSCINEAIKLEEEMNNSSEVMTNEIVEAPLLNLLEPKTIPPLLSRTISNELKSCPMPKVKETFNVLVTMCSNPSNFRVCSYDDYPQLHDLMVKLQDYCSTDKSLVDMRDIKIGQTFAGLHNDDNWYRVVIEENCNDSTVMVLCCDYGELVMMSTNNLRILPNEFKQLPKQALKASLYGIKPINNDWEIEDCLYFQEIAAGKNFASFVENINDIDDSKLELTLIDVTTNVDVYINRKLVMDGKANFC